MNTSTIKTLLENIVPSISESPLLLEGNTTIVPYTALTIESQLTPKVNCSLPDSALFHPIIVTPQDDNTYCIVDGYKKYHNLKGVDNIECVVLERLLTAQERAVVRLYLNKDRQKSTEEKFLYYKWIVENFPKEEHKRVLSTIQFSPKDVKTAQELLETSEELRNLIFQGTFDPSLAKGLAQFNEDDRLLFIEIFKNYNLSLQYQKEFTDWLPEIAYAQQCSISDILHNSYIQKTLNNEKLNIPQKTQKLRTYLFGQKHPLLTDIQKQWKKDVNDINPNPSFVRIDPNLFFEKNRLEMKIILTNSKRAGDIMKKLSEITEEQWDRLINPFT